MRGRRGRVKHERHEEKEEHEEEDEEEEEEEKKKKKSSTRTSTRTTTKRSDDRGLTPVPEEKSEHDYGCKFLGSDPKKLQDVEVRKVERARGACRCG
ncbi:MAG: hypothetical protein JXQ29_09665 [Planctomycetes bacterium]|nr:hypothetical protein [Planctomycetota bacterium]